MSSRESNIIDSEPSADDSLPSLFLILNGPVTTSSSVERARWDLAFKFMLPDVSSENSGDLSSPNRPSIVIDPETESGTASPTASISPVTTASPTTPTSPSGQLAELGISDPSSSTQCKVVEHDGGIEDYTTIAASFDGDIRAVSEGQIAQMSVTSDMQNVSQLYKMSLVRAGVYIYNLLVVF
ncbi:hypothetical protein C8Q72DRAFT_628234 [Fomitopsis betulina]|nr:hypothetical protein C8Q72DRAFT_628234 [Fomitopsis betulina]